MRQTPKKTNPTKTNEKMLQIMKTTNPTEKPTKNALNPEKKTNPTQNQQNNAHNPENNVSNQKPTKKCDKP